MWFSTLQICRVKTHIFLKMLTQSYDQVSVLGRVLRMHKDDVSVHYPRTHTVASDPKRKTVLVGHNGSADILLRDDGNPCGDLSEDRDLADDWFRQFGRRDILLAEQIFHRDSQCLRDLRHCLGIRSVPSLMPIRHLAVRESCLFADVFLSQSTQKHRLSKPLNEYVHINLRNLRI